jgi:hypothetical protein
MYPIYIQDIRQVFCQPGVMTKQRKMSRIAEDTSSMSFVLNEVVYGYTKNLRSLSP